MDLKSIIKQVVSKKLEETQTYNWKPLNEAKIAQRLREDKRILQLRRQKLQSEE